MKTALITLSFLLVAVIVLFFILGFMSRTGKAPGLFDGKLSKCPDKPNCVCSEQKTASHYIEPVIIPEHVTVDAFSVLKDTITDMGGSIQAESDNYLAATFTSAIFRFRDDLEIRTDSAQNVVHIRAASRVGHSDMGVNRERVALFRKLYVQRLTDKPGQTITN